MDFLSFLPKQFEMLRLIIVGPYPSHQYISDLIKKNKVAKEKLYLVVDDGWDTEEIDNLLGNDHVKKVQATTTDGLVHAKMYYCVYKENNVQKIMLVTASANASFNGMKKNAESFTAYRLCLFSKEQQENISNYFNSLKNGKNVKSLMITLNNNGKLKLFLPAINQSNTKETFASWIRSGYLFYKYIPDSSFGVVTIKLKKAIPSTINWGDSRFANADNESRKELKWPYLTKKAREGETKNLTLSKYAVETRYGRWVSRECYNIKKDEFVSTKKNSVKKQLKKISQDDIVSKISTALDNLKKINQDNNEILDILKNITQDQIKTQVSCQIQKDKNKVNNKIFLERYETGFERSTVPRLDSEQLEEFIESWFASCILKGKKRGKSLLAKKIESLIKTDSMKQIFSKINLDEPYSPATLTKWFLDENWNSIIYLKSKKTLAQKIKTYYVESKK
ncbi:MAG: hypothetical protein HUJ68_04290 [Clostridia bacterium]|nr:hypothetical protein [Clostridia bacterium]